MKESAIQKSILQYLAVKRIFAVRVNSGVTVATTGGKRRAIHMAAAGTADIMAILGAECEDYPASHKKILWIEVKTSGGKQSELQRSFQMQVEDLGHCYVIARSIDDVEAAL